VITEARDLRKKITGGVVAPDDARRALANLRQRHKKIAAHVPSIRTAYDRAMKTIEDPAARVAELTSRFGILRR
jgi:predicted transcriptional regulator